MSKGWKEISVNGKLLSITEIGKALKNIPTILARGEGGEGLEDGVLL